MSPLISIIIPNYNHKKFLEKRIQSVLNQTYQNFEIIFLDDASTDGSKEVLQQYAVHTKVSCIEINTVNCGSTFVQWQKAFQLVKGDLIWIAESDDYCDNTLLEILIQQFLKNEQLVLAYCGSNTVDENENITGALVRTEITNDTWYYNNGGNEVAERLIFGPLIPNASAVLFKKTALQNVDASFMNYKICGDWQFWIDICYSGDIAYTTHKLNYFRRPIQYAIKPRFTQEESVKIFHLEILKLIKYVIVKKNIKLSFYKKLKITWHYQRSILFPVFRKQLSLKMKDYYNIYIQLLRINFLAPIALFPIFKEALLLQINKVRK